MKKFGTVVVVLVTCLLLLGTVFAQTNQHSDIERKIIVAANQCIDGEGACEIDLAEIFTGFEWDTVSIFVGGNSKQIRENLGIDHDISDGIVFSLNGKPIRVATSTYQFPQDVPPDVGYHIERASAEAPYYISLSRENAIVLVKKYAFHNDQYKYLVYCE